ncbi:MAG: PDZ domain-containing protein, partial [Anaerolineae bacterium]|nr:PDZ domain-containing protein [Anaerolineae bacterium]
MKKVWIIGGSLVAAAVLVTVAFLTGLTVGKFGANIGVEPVKTIYPTAVYQVEDGEVPATVESPQEESTIVPEEQLPPDGDEVPDEGQTEVPFDYAILDTVLELLGEQFYGEIPDETTLAYGAIRGMLMTLDDQYTSFVDPEITAILNEDASGAFEGIGAIVNMRSDGFLEIVSLIPGQPAEAAGILPGDIILAVDGENIENIEQLIETVNSNVGNEITLTINRDGTT